MGKIQAAANASRIDCSAAPAGVSDRACPECGPSCRSPSNRTRKVLRVWNQGGFITYLCARCGASGWQKGDSSIAAAPPKYQGLRKGSRTQLAARLWERSMPLEGTLAESYLRARQCYLPTTSLRYLPPWKNNPPTMIAKFYGKDGVHLTRINAQGTGKAGTDRDKCMLGDVSGPIVLRIGTGSGVVICEGIEDGMSLAIAMPDITVWAAGSAGALAKLVGIPTETPTVAFDLDKAGLNAYRKCIAIRKDIGTIRFPRLRDANTILRTDGIARLKELIESGHSPFHRRAWASV